MGSIEKRARNGQLRWYARYRDPGGTQLVKVFGRKLDAERFLTTVEASKLTGSYIDAKRASITFRAFAEEHRAAHMHNLAAETPPGHSSDPCSTGTPSQPSVATQSERLSQQRRAAVASWAQTLAPGTVGCTRLQRITARS